MLIQILAKQVRRNVQQTHLTVMKLNCDEILENILLQTFFGRKVE